MSRFKLKPIAMLLLFKIAVEEDRNWYQRPASLFNDDLARDLDCSEDTIQRARESLVKAGLLHYERVGDRRAALYWVKELPYWEPLTRPTPSRATVRTDAEPVQRTVRTGADLTADASADATADPKYLREESRPNSPPPPGRTWQEVEGKLVEAKIQMTRRAIANAQREGYSPDQAFACCEYFLQHRQARGWNPGLLYTRFTDHPPGTAADSGWPSASPQSLPRWTPEQEAARAAREAEQLAQARAKSEAAAAAAAHLRRRHEQLLLQFGDEVDRLTPAQRAELVRDRSPALVREVLRHRDWREAHLIRGPLLEAFAARYGSN